MSLSPASVVPCLRLWTAVLVALALASPGLAQNSAPARQGPVERVQVHGASLAGNLEGDSPDRVAAAADQNIGAGAMNEMILVSPDAYTVHGGSMYSASPTTGDWETFIAEDHNNRVPQRIEEAVLPFFSQHLSFTVPR